jgi:hypothetical protein
VLAALCTRAVAAPRPGDTDAGTARDTVAAAGDADGVADDAAADPLDDPADDWPDDVTGDAGADDELGREADVDRELVDELTASPDAIDAVDATADLDALGIGGIAGSEDWLEAQERHRRPSWLGRIDLSVAWLHRIDLPGDAPAHTFDEVWLLAIWRR